MNIIHTISIWLVVAAFFAAGLSNMIGKRATRESFVRWGYPRWWNWVTGGLEISSAILITFPPVRDAGLVLGATIMAAAALTVLRHREYSHLVPIGVYFALIALAAFLP
jgi:uncharacterized membrane protein YphA (DoxX/SURF4 family)